jgi:cytoskeletal protein RodZ
MPDRDPAGFGAKLREARERRGISLRQIADRTRISIAVLEALERDDISRLPGGIFSRAFVRSYANEVGLDPEATIGEFVSRFPTDSVTVGHAASRPIEDNEAIESERRIASSVLWLVLLAVPLTGVVLYFVAAGRQPAPVQSQSPPIQGTAAAALAAVPEPTPAQPPASQIHARAEERPEATAGDTLTVVVTATDRCWVSAIVDGERSLQRELAAGEKHAFDVRRELVITAGNAGALEMVVNGVEARPLGKSGQVVTARLNLGNFKDYLVPQ